MSRDADPPIIAIVVPLYAHSVLVADALLSAVEQVSRYRFVIVVVNDGCRFAETDVKIRSIVTVHPDVICYVAQKNAGLSAARNTGVSHALAKFPTLQAIYFLDADNAIQPKAIDNAYSTLLRHPQASWVYPNIDMFGIRRNFDYHGAYSVLKHTRYNICEAGSLVHRRVFDAGVRFDDTMKLGYEDWDFWLSAAAHGFRGVHDAYFGFRYRNRAESMLSQSKRDDAEIAAYMRAKHRSLLDRRNLARLEAEEAPRYAVVFTETNEALLTNGAIRGEQTLSQTAFDELFWRNLVIPDWQYMPPIFIFTTRATLDELQQTGLVPWVFYDCERSLATANFASVVLARRAGYTYATESGGATRDCSILCIGRDLLCSIIKDLDTQWIEKIQAPDAAMNVATKTLTLPLTSLSSSGASGSVVFAFLSRVMAWRTSQYRPAAQCRWIWRDVSVPPPHALADVVRQAFAGEVVYPAVRTTDRSIGFVISIGSFGGVERVAYNVAREFARAGWQIHLFLLGGSRIEMPEQFFGMAASVNMVEDPVLSGWDPHSEYHGTALPAAGSGQSQAVQRMVALLGWLDVVVNCHSGAFNAAAASLRKLGVRTVTHLHLLDHSPLGRSGGHAMITLAYEHAYDLVVCNSLQLVGWMHAAGIPQEKLIHLRNAPGHAIDAVVRKQYQERRGRPVQRLQVLYLGRLDRQKGMHRLAGVVDGAERRKLPVDWRIVGAAVAGDCEVPRPLAKFHEPAVFGRDALVSLLHWADVLVLLSDYEGVPLSVLEAQRAGVVVIATRVGALSEIIDSGRTGFLVEVPTAVEETVDLLELLCESPKLRSAIGASAAAVPEWPQTTVDLIERVTAMVAAPQRSLGPAVSGRAAARDGKSA